MFSEQEKALSSSTKMDNKEVKEMLNSWTYYKKLQCLVK